MNRKPTPSKAPPVVEKSSEALPAPLSDAEARRLDLETERDARQQAGVGQTVRGGGLKSRG